MLHPLDIYTFPILVCFPHPSALGNGSVISGMEIEDRDRGSRRRWLNISFQVMTRCRVSPNRSLCPPGARWPVDLHTDSFRFLHFRMRFLLRRRAGLHKSIDLSAACRRFCSHWRVCWEGGIVGGGAHWRGKQKGVASVGAWIYGTASHNFAAARNKLPRK